MVIVFHLSQELHRSPASSMTSEKVRDIELVLQDFSNGMEDKPDFQKDMENIKGWINDQRKKGDEEKIAKIGAALTTTVNALQKIQSGNPEEVACGTLEIISSVAAVVGGPYGVAISAVCSIAGAIISANKPAQPSVVEQLANVVHSELNNFHHQIKLEKLDGLKGRVKRQLTQLRDMKKKQELDDPGLWNFYDQFMGELKRGVESAIPFKYEDNLEKDDKFAVFRKAVVIYCNAYTCFMGLLTVAKGKFQKFDDSSDMVDKIDRLIVPLRSTTKETLTFLSDKKYLKFIGRLPSENGNLAKILLLTRNPAAKKVVELVRKSLELPEMPVSEVVEEAAEKVSRQIVKLKFKGKEFSDATRVLFSVVDFIPTIPPIGSATTVLFINETDFPMRIVSGTVGWPKGNLEFQQDVDSHSYYDKVISSFTGTFSTGGYIKIAYNGKLSSKEDPNEGDVGIIEFALESPWARTIKINIQDKSEVTRTKGTNTYDGMTDDKGKTLYWKRGEVHYLARAEVLRTTAELYTDWASFRKFNLLPYTSNAKGTWCFIIQDFDPEQDVVEEEK